MFDDIALMIVLVVGLIAIRSFNKWTRSNELILQELRISNRPFFHGTSARNHVASFTFDDPEP